ncbi:hypothetical protein FRC12_022802 [Ceratobasidium sp. 428]|nr:hypothetical protein FRC12_022802 [Ceratobasidium sp. 428]
MNNPSLLDQEPECTYDQLLADGTPVVKPRTKYKALEDRIGELETMLKAQSTQQPGPTHEDYLSSADTSLASESALSASMSEQSEDDLSQYLPLINDPLPAEPPLYSNQLPQLSGYTPPASEQQLVWAEWPPRLPPPDLLNHLVEVFFNCHPHAHYLLHRPTFMVSLTLPPRSPKFPHISLLHAICAYASVFSYLVDSPPMPNLDKARGDNPLPIDTLDGQKKLGTKPPH